MYIKLLWIHVAHRWTCIEQATLEALEAYKFGPLF